MYFVLTRFLSTVEIKLTLPLFHELPQFSFNVPEVVSAWEKLLWVETVSEALCNLFEGNFCNGRGDGSGREGGRSATVRRRLHLVAVCVCVCVCECVRKVLVQ